MTSPLDRLLDPIRDRLAALESRVRTKASVHSATVTSVDPIRFQLDGEDAPKPITPDALVPVHPGDRVRLLHHGRTTYTIIGRTYAALGRVPVHAPNATWWSRDLHWFRNGPLVTLIGRPLRSQSTLTTSSVAYTLPSHLRPVATWNTPAVQQRETGRSVGVASIHPDGRVVIRSNDPSGDMIATWSVHFDITYPSPYGQED